MRRSIPASSPQLSPDSCRTKPVAGATLLDDDLEGPDRGLSFPYPLAASNLFTPLPLCSRIRATEPFPFFLAAAAAYGIPDEVIAHDDPAAHATRTQRRFTPRVHQD